MKTERRLLNKYDEFLTILARATLSFKKKEEIDYVNRLLKEIVMLKKQRMRDELSKESDDLQMKIKFRKDRR